jgi:hypothetical protein
VLLRVAAVFKFAGFAVSLMKEGIVNANRNSKTGTQSREHLLPELQHMRPTPGPTQVQDRPVNGKRLYLQLQEVLEVEG